MASPPQQEIYMDFDRFDNSSNACYYMGNIEASKIGEWLLQDNSGHEFTYTYFRMLRNFTGEFMSKNPGEIYGYLPHLLLGLVLTSTLSHSLHFFLSRLKQPLIISQIIVVFIMFLPWTNGGHGDRSDDNFFNIPSKRHLESAIGFIALTFKAFVYAFKTDISMMWRIGKKPIIIGLASLIVPFLSALVISYILYNNIRSFVMHKEKFVLFLAAMYSHSPFIVLSDILSEFGLLSSELGRLTLSSSMVQTTTGLVLLGLFGIVNQGQHDGTLLLITITINVFIAAFVVFIVRPYSVWIVQDTHSKGYVREAHLFVITITMLLLAMLSDVAGAVFFFGPIMMGFALPNGSALGTALVDRIEVVGQELLMPIYFLIVGRNLDWAAAWQQSGLWMSLDLIILIICLAKFATAAIGAYCCGMSLNNGMILGLIMNFKGFFEIIVLMYLYYGQVFDAAALTMMMASVLVITAICAPLASLFYKPLKSENNNSSACHTVHNAHTHAELRVLSYFFDEKPIPILLDFLECLTSQEIRSHTSIYPLHLVDLNARVASSLINHRNKNGQINMKQMELLHKHFISFVQEKTKNVTVLPFTSIAPQQNMDKDICAFIIERNIDLVIVPFPRKNSSIACLNANHSTWSLVPKVLEKARSSVGIMVYHGIQQITLVSRSFWQYHIGVVFFGGPDDREGIAIASRMACHPKVHINLLRFFTCDTTKNHKKKIEDSHDDAEEKLDNEVIDDFQRENINNDRLVVSEVTTTDVEKIIVTLHTFGEKYDVVIVGRRRGNSSLILSLALEEGMESRELGVIGDMLASSKYENPANILVVQNHEYV